MQASRVRTDDELFETAPSTGLRSLEEVGPAWPDADRDAIAKELGAPSRDQVSFVIHAKPPDRRGRINEYELTGTFGEGPGYDPLQDKAALQRVTLNALAAGAAKIGAAAKGKA
jgi:hypothetical protein